MSRKQEYLKALSHLLTIAVKLNKVHEIIRNVGLECVFGGEERHCRVFQGTLVSSCDSTEIIWDNSLK
jgi:hypothetical protein